MSNRSCWMEADYYIGASEIRVATIVSERFHDGYSSYAETDVDHEDMLDVPAEVQAMSNGAPLYAALSKILADNDYRPDGEWESVYADTVKVGIVIPDEY